MLITHARFAERVAYMASHCAQWAGSCLTLPEEVNEPMSAWSVRRFIDETQKRLDFMREDLAAIEAHEALPTGAPPQKDEGR